MKEVHIRRVPDYFVQQRNEMQVKWIQVLAAGIQVLRQQAEAAKPNKES